MNTRFKKLRKELKLTQEEFAKKTELSRSYINLIEMGKKTPADRTIRDICQKFKVNYEWLAEGKGDEIFVQNKRKSEIADFVGSVLNSEADSFKMRLIEILATLDESEWEKLQELANALADKKEE